MQWRLFISPLILSHCKDENSFWNGKGKGEKNINSVIFFQWIACTSYP